MALAPAKIQRPPRISARFNPAARDLGTRVFEGLRHFGSLLAHGAERSTYIGKRVARETAHGLQQGWSKAVEFSGVLDVDSRPTRTPGKHRPSPTATADPTQPFVAVTPGGVGLVEYSPTRQHLLEVSMLESLGFYDPATIVVAVSAPMTATATLPPPNGRKAPLIPDLDLVGWKPHVIARSKLNPGSMRLTTAGILAVLTVLVVTLVLAVIRTPQVSQSRLHQTVAVQASTMQVALIALSDAFGSGEGAAAAATTTALVDVDIAARGLFGAASRLDPNTDQAMRSAAISISERSLELENGITQALSYRLALGPLWRSPDLDAITHPTEAAEALAPWQAQIEHLAAGLPDTDGLSEHAASVAAFIAGIDAWVPVYIEALAIGDNAAGMAAVAALEARLAELAHSVEAVISDIVANANTDAGLLVSELGGLAG
jgi:hypothetical protein